MLKLATTEQIEFYEKVLYPMQDTFFSLLQSDKFYLTGETCLSRFYFHHRYSDDLDFFFMGQQDELGIFELECNKITAIHDRKTNKDYIDLYFLLKEINLLTLVEWSNLKKVPLDFEGTFLSLSFGKLEGDVYMIREVSESEFQSFIKTLTGDILKYAKTIS